MNDQVTEYINNAPAGQKEIMEQIRKIIHDTLPGLTESYKWSRPIFSAGKDVAYLKATKAYVTLGFFHFDKLEDPNNLLEGTGKDMRHIKLKKAEDIDKALLKKWFTALAK